MANERWGNVRDSYETPLLQRLATRAPGGFAFFLACLVASTFFELVRFPERTGTMLAFAAAFVALMAVSWGLIRWRPRATLWVLLVLVNVVGVALNAYHAIVGATVAMCLWTLTGLLASTAVVLRWGGVNQTTAALGALLSYPLHWYVGIVDGWTWAAGGTYLVVVAAMSVFGAVLYDRYQKSGLLLTAALSEREARLQSYFDLAPVGTAVLAANACIQEANDELCLILGAGRAELLGEAWPPFDDRVPRILEASHVTAALDGTLDGGPRDVRLRRRDGAVIDATVGMRSLPGLDGVPDHVMLVVEDVTQRRRTEQEREELLVRELTARQEAEAASRAKDAFLTTLSHELRTPLTPILSWAHLLRTGGLDEQQTRRAVEVIERNAAAQAQLVEDLLDVSRIAAGKLHVKRGPVHLGPVVRDAVDVVRPAALERDVALAVHGEGDSCWVSADAGRLRQVFWNLLSNAVKFAGAGGRVDLTIVRDGDRVRVELRDTGAGIAPDFLPHVFERFRQGDGRVSRQHGGLGVGLAIVRDLVELHGGTVRAESAGPGRGATFTVELPVIARPTGSPSPVVEAPAEKPLRGLRVLLVDDDRDSREVVRFLLARSGADVAGAASAGQAVALLTQGRRDVLVSDIAMPDEDGYALLARVRAGEGGHPDLPAIALTAFSTPEDRDRALAGGFQEHVAKPVEIDALVAAVRAVCTGAAG